MPDPYRPYAQPSRGQGGAHSNWYTNSRPDAGSVNQDAPSRDTLVSLVLDMQQDADQLWDKSKRPLAGTGDGDMMEAIGMKAAINRLRALLGMRARNYFPMGQE